MITRPEHRAGRGCQLTVALDRVAVRVGLGRYEARGGERHGRGSEKLGKHCCYGGLCFDIKRCFDQRQVCFAGREDSRRGKLFELADKQGV